MGELIKYFSGNIFIMKLTTKDNEEIKRQIIH